MPQGRSFNVLTVSGLPRREGVPGAILEHFRPMLGM